MRITDTALIEMLAEASEGAYADSQNVKINGYTKIETLEDAGTGYALTVLENAATHEYIFAFRGTDTIQDVYTDLTVGIRQWNQSNRQEVADRIQQYIAAAPSATFHFTGHSLGGALAQFAAYDYAKLISGSSDAASLFETFDLVTFNALGGALGIDLSELYSNGYEPSLAQSIQAVHFRTPDDIVSRLGEDHIGGELLVVPKPLPTPYAAHAIANFTGSDGSYPVTGDDYSAAVLNEDYLDIRNLVSVSGILASVGDDGVFTPEEAWLRTFSALAFGISSGSAVEISELVGAFFGSPDTIGQETYDALILLGSHAVLGLQRSGLVGRARVAGAYSFVLADILQNAAQYWEENPNLADALGRNIDWFVDSVLKRGASLVDSAMLYAVANEFVAGEYLDAIDFTSHMREWIGRYFAASPINDLYIQGTAGDDFLSGNGSFWPGKNLDDHIFGYAGNDILEGGKGSDYLIGGAGADAFYWNSGDGHDLIGDYDDGGDRIFVDGVDLATLAFERQLPGAPFYHDSSNPNVRIHYDGSFLTVHAGSGSDAGSVTVTQFAPAQRADYGISLGEASIGSPVTDLSVLALGAAPGEVASHAFDRQWPALQGGHDWANMALEFDADKVANYLPGQAHGTVGGAFEGGPGNDHLRGGPASNALHGLAGNDFIEGEAGEDFLEGGAGSDQLYGGEGDDLIFGNARAGLLHDLDPGSHYGQFYLPQITEAAPDLNMLDGGPGADYIGGGEFQDIITGGEGSDYLLGGSGSDEISGGTGRDVIYGDSGLNYRLLESAPGVQLLEVLEIAFSDGRDHGQFFDDRIFAGDGDDTVWGELGDDIVYGGAGNDNLIGDRYNDAVYFSAEPGPYADTSPELDSGLHGNDRLYGGEGGDLLVGLGGSDYLSGGSDSDTLLGGAGDDVYFFAAGDGLDYIQDSEGVHTLVFSGIALGDLQVVFEGDKVLVGAGHGAEGFYFAKSQWPNVRIALDTASALVERSRLDTFYLDAGGQLLLTLNATHDMTEIDREELFTVDSSDPGRPRIVFGAGVDQVEIEEIAGTYGSAKMRITGGELQLTVDLAARQMQTGLDFLSLADHTLLSLIGFAGGVNGSDGDDRIVGSASADTIRAGNGNDVLEGRAGNDKLYGGWGDDLLVGEQGNDRLDGGAGNDTLRGGQGNDYLYSGLGGDRGFLDGGVGSDVLEGGTGQDILYFDRGDGMDVISDPAGSLYLEFGSAVDPADIVLRLTSHGDDRFVLDYGENDSMVADGGASARRIAGMAVGGVAAPLVQRSQLTDGYFHDTRWHDVFETGAGNDIIYVSGHGDDVYRLSPGDSFDTIMVDNGYYPEPKGDIRFTSGVKLEELSFSFSNGAATIAYGNGDALSIETDLVYSPRDNVLARFTLSSEADADWIPTIRAEGYVGDLSGTYGTDHIIGSQFIEDILPGYGNDIIEAGDSPDRIVLNEAYLHDKGGVGHKQIWGEGDNDTIHSPLFQGLTFHYDRGDGFDTIEYDWSYSWDAPYHFALDYAQGTAEFLPYGEDAIMFGAGIGLGDLLFNRSGANLEIALLDGSGGINIPDFFALAGSAPASSNLLFDLLADEAPLPDSLLSPLIAGALPAMPIAKLGFADGSTHALDSVIGDQLQEWDSLSIGTTSDDHLFGTAGDDAIYGLQGNDTIEDMGGSNVLYGGPGDDVFNLSSDNWIDAGPGNDIVAALAGINVIRFGPGSDQDGVLFDAQNASLTVILTGGLTVDDIVVSPGDPDSGEGLKITLASSGDALALQGLRLDPGSQQWVADSSGASLELRFEDGTVLSGSELTAMAGAPQGDIIVGTNGKDVLTGTERDDRLEGLRGRDVLNGGAGDDVLIGGRGRDTLSGGQGDDSYLFAAGDGRDVIHNNDPDTLANDVLALEGIAHDEVWLSRQRKHLVVTGAGSTDRVMLKNWYRNDDDKLDEIHAGGQVLLREQVDLLVNAMAAFDVPEGVGVFIPEQARIELEPLLAQAWQSAA